MTSTTTSSNRSMRIGPRTAFLPCQLLSTPAPRSSTKTTYKLSWKQRSPLLARRNNHLQKRSRRTRMRRALIFIVTQFVLLLPIAAALDRQANADYRTRRQAVAKKTEGGRSEEHTSELQSR